MTPICIVPMLLFAGFFVKQDNIPKWLWWFREISIFKYGYQIQFLNEFEDLELECMTAQNINERCDPLKDYNSPQTIGQSFAILLGLTVVFYGIAFFIMTKLKV